MVDVIKITVANGLAALFVTEHTYQDMCVPMSCSYHEPECKIN